MRKVLLKIRKLKVKGNGKEILKGINFQIKRGEIQALLGPNSSGKSTLSHVILGDPKYKVIQGKIFFNGKEITRLAPEKRVKLGVALAWQSPPAIKGVKFSQLLEKITKTSGQNEFVAVRTEIEEAKDFLERDILERDVNVDFSGGEKKISELLQIISLNPKLVIFDEIDSGLDLKRVEKFAQIIKRRFLEKGISILLITHWGQILNYLKPDLVNVMLDGKIICKEKNFKKVIGVIKKYGYEKCKECPFLADK